MRLKDGLKLVLMEDGYILYDPEKERIFQLNITSSYLLEMVMDGKSKDEIIQSYADTFGVSKEVASKDLEKFLLMLKQEGLIED